MLRPERMSRVSVTGSKRVMDDAIETVHDMRLLHLTGYGDDWEGFSPGDPIEGAESGAEKLVTVRSLQSILGVDGEEAGPARLVTEDALDDELEEIRVEVNELDDRRDELRNELRDVEERIDSMAPFAALGVDMDLLSGYDSVEVAVGTGDSEAVRRTLVEAECDYELLERDGVLGVFARAPGEEDLDDVLVGTAFQQLEIPEAEGSPEDYLSQLEARRQELESELSTVEDELDGLRLEVGGFLLAAEETLAVAVQQQEAPLDFATTENAFVAEGWIPTERFVDLAEGLHDAVGDHVEVDELERAAYNGDGRIIAREEVDAPGAPATPAAAGDGGRTAAAAGGANAAGATGDAESDAEEAETEEVATDGGHATAGGHGGATGAGDRPMRSDAPPVVQDNPGPVKPFESLVGVINRPKYSELDPSVVLFLTFPAFFGFMIGDLGYGLLYMGLGWYVMQRMESDIVRSLGGVAMWAGGFTALFGILYGEFFGLHQLGGILWGGNPPIHKGLQPHYLNYAMAWLLLSVIVGVLHLVLARSFDFAQNLRHGTTDAVLESGSWILLTVGVWVFVFSTLARGPKPDFIFTVFNTGEEAAFSLGFAGFPPVVGYVGLAVAAIGLVLVMAEEGVGMALIESITQAFGHVISYTRLAAVLLAKAGMALAVNVIVFGAYAHGGEFHLITFSDPAAVEEAASHGDVIFSGLMNADGGVGLVVGGLVGVLILVIGHLLVLVLGITSAGLQGIRLEYVEFFSKFYEGGGEAYEPFGYERQYTTDD